MPPVIQLHLSSQGSRGVICNIDSDAQLKRKLMSLGLRAGQPIQVLQQRNKGVVVLSRGNRIALDASVASRIHIASEPDD